MKQQTFPSIHVAPAIFILMRKVVFYKKHLLILFPFMFMLDMRCYKAKVRSNEGVTVHLLSRFS
jgi:hypothetical protein